MAKEKDPVLDALKKASKGLQFTSETEAPLEPFVWPDAGAKLTDAQVRKQAGAEKGTAVEQMTLDDFFHAVELGKWPARDPRAMAAAILGR